MNKELNVIAKTYDFTLWSLNHIGKFPRDHRHGIGEEIEHKLSRLLDFLIQAKYSRDKFDSLQRAAMIAEQLRFRIRMAKDLRLISIRSHDFAVDCLLDIARQVASWKKYVSGSQGEEPEPPDSGDIS